MYLEGDILFHMDYDSLAFVDDTLENFGNDQLGSFDSEIHGPSQEDSSHTMRYEVATV